MNSVTLSDLVSNFIIRNYNAVDIEGLADELNITNCDDLVFDSDNINDVYSNFLKILEDAVKKYIPTKTITVRPNDKPYSSFASLTKLITSFLISLNFFQ
jgi:hypothetical protein